MRKDYTRNVDDFENVVFLCCGRPKGDELPQVATEDDTIIDLVQSCSFKPSAIVSAQLHHQTADE